jgi:hypothetical protein
MLTFGHSVFEPVYTLAGGRALLASLGERPQLSIAEIEVDAQGDLTQVTQYGDVVSARTRRRSPLTGSSGTSGTRTARTGSGTRCCATRTGRGC